MFLSLLAGYLGTSTNLAPIVASHGLSEKSAGALLSVFQPLTAHFHSGRRNDVGSVREPPATREFGSRQHHWVRAYSFGNGLPTMRSAVTLIGFSVGFWPLLAAACAARIRCGWRRACVRSCIGLHASRRTDAIRIAKTQEITGSYAPGLSAVALLTLLGGMACLLMMRERHRGRVLQVEEAAPKI